MPWTERPLRNSGRTGRTRNASNVSRCKCSTAALEPLTGYGHDPVQTLRDAYAQRELGTADDVPAVLHWRIEKALEGINQPVVRLIDREPVDGVPAWIADGRRHQDQLLPAEWRDHLAERHHYIGVRLKERGAVLALEEPAWTQGLGRLPSEPWRMFDWHRTEAEVDVLRTKYRIDPSEPQAIPDKLRGNPIADSLQERVTALHKAAALSTAPEVTVSTREHYATHAAERSAAERTALLAAADGVQQATATAAATAVDVVAETSTEAAAETTSQASTTQAAPGAETTPVAAASPTTAQEGITMSDPLDETLEHVGGTTGRAAQTITSEISRQLQRAADERRRALQDAQRKADRERDAAVRDAQRKADREREKAEQQAAREQERVDRLEHRYPTAEANLQQDTAAATATGVAIGAAAAETIDNATDTDVAAISSDGRDAAAAETAAIAAEGQADAGDAASAPLTRAQRERAILEGAGYDPDERVNDDTSTSAEQARRDDYRAPETSRGDEGIER